MHDSWEQNYKTDGIFKESRSKTWENYKLNEQWEAKERYDGKVSTFHLKL